MLLVYLKVIKLKLIILHRVMFSHMQSGRNKTKDLNGTLNKSLILYSYITRHPLGILPFLNEDLNTKN